MQISSKEGQTDVQHQHQHQQLGYKTPNEVYDAMRLAANHAVSHWRLKSTNAIGLREKYYEIKI